MGKIFTKEGKLNFPLDIIVDLPQDKYGVEKEALIIYHAFCQNGHNLISDQEINGHRGLHFLYINRKTKEEKNIVVSAIVCDNTKLYQKGTPCEDNEEVQVLCPECRAELPVLLNCKCGSPMYLFYMDQELKKNYAQSFCSKIGCSQGSKIRFSHDILLDYLRERSF